VTFQNTSKNGIHHSLLEVIINNPDVCILSQAQWFKIHEKLELWSHISGKVKGCLHTPCFQLAQRVTNLAIHMDKFHISCGWMLGCKVRVKTSLWGWPVTAQPTFKLTLQAMHTPSMVQHFRSRWAAEITQTTQPWILHGSCTTQTSCCKSTIQNE